ncbi:MAG: hypothetical protein ACQGVK_12285 [Myxococcota bacterium]
MPGARSRSLAVRAALVAGALAVACRSPSPEPVDPEARLASYDAPVIDYLESLGPEDVGRRLEGVRVDPGDPESGELLLEGALYLGRTGGLPEHVHVHLVEEGEERLAYLWVDTGGEPFALPECNPRRVGFRARRIWGPIYTWKAARPGDGVLVSSCPEPSWVENATKSPRSLK